MKLKFSISFLFLICIFSSLIAQNTAIPFKGIKPSIVPFKDEKTNLFGFKNQSGDILVPSKYTYANAFLNGMAAVNMGGKVKLIDEFSNEYIVTGGKWGYVNTQGELVIPLKYDAADFFEGDFAIVEMKGKKAFIDKAGKALMPFIYDYINPFYEDLAAVGGGEPLTFSYIDKTGKVVITDGYSSAGDFFNGKARVTRYAAVYFINTKGERLR